MYLTVIATRNKTMILIQTLVFHSDRHGCQERLAVRQDADELPEFYAHE